MQLIVGNQKVNVNTVKGISPMKCVHFAASPDTVHKNKIRTEIRTINANIFKERDIRHNSAINACRILKIGVENYPHTKETHNDGNTQGSE